MNNVIIRYYDFPPQVKGFTKEDENGDYNVYINATLNYEQQEHAKRHELNHIEFSDFNGIGSLSHIECRAG